MDKLLMAFNLSDLQTFRNIIELIEPTQYTYEDVVKYTENEVRKANNEEMKVLRQIINLPRCPIHDKNMFATEITHDNKNNIKSLWNCPHNLGLIDDPDYWCDYEILSTKTVEEIMSDGKVA